MLRISFAVERENLAKSTIIRLRCDLHHRICYYSAILCLVYNRKQSFPPTRSRLYNKALDILLEEWAAEKRVQQEPIHEGIHTDLEKVMLAEIAHMVNLSESEIKALDNYFYANLLMVECKNAAVRVSRKTWSEIESRMLMPFRERT